MRSKSVTLGTIADVKPLTCIDIKTLVFGVISSLNQPSGLLKPYTKALLLTKKIEELLKMFDVKLIDQIIITPNDEHYSFCDMGEI